MRKITILIGTLLLVTGCFHEMHELQPSEWGDVPVGYLASSLSWGSAGDADTPIHNLTYAIGGPGVSFSRRFASAEQAAGQLIQMPVGTYDVLAMVNMTEEDGYIVSGLPATKAFPSEVTVSLKDPASSPQQAWYWVAPAEVEEDAITRMEPQMQRLMVTLNVHVANVPAGSTLVLTLCDVAQNVALTEKDLNGHYGVPSEESVGDLVLASLTATSTASP